MKKKIFALALATTGLRAVAFDTNGRWKMDGDQLARDANGNPIIVLADGNERTVQGDTITRLNGEARDHRLRAEKAEAALEAFKDLDPAVARDALDKISKIDAKTLIDAGEIDKVRSEISAGFTAQLTEKDGALSKAQQRINDLLIKAEFGSSKFIAEKLAVPREMFEATFGRNFKVEDDRVVPYGQDGNKIYSRKNHGEVASVDEAFEILIESYPHKDQILRAPDIGGSGGSGNGGNRGGGRTVRRSEFEGLPPAQQATMAQAAAKGEIKIVD